MKQSFEKFLRERCPSEYQTNNSSEGEDKWLEQLDGSEYEKFGQAYGDIMYSLGGIDAYNKSIDIVNQLGTKRDDDRAFEGQREVLKN